MSADRRVATQSQQRGVQGKGGKLSAQLEANKKKPLRGQEEDESRLMVSKGRGPKGKARILTPQRRMQDRGNWN